MKKQYKFIAAAAAVTLTASAVAPVANAASFSDLKGHVHEDEILSLVNMGIINGYPDGTFRPNQALTRSDVVKLLGKYLVSLGHEVPTDYKTKMRFTDLTAKSQDELLQYAALVKDVGVFNGSNGLLMHRDEIRRDQMATVLVRAFKVINDFDYVAHVKDQDFKSSITDLSRTTAEHQESITVFDYYDITKQMTFSPKDVTKRGQFASFLFNMLQVETPKPEPELTIKKVEVQAVDKVRVTLSDDKSYIVTLATPLVENVETEISFKIAEKDYKAKVKYEVADLKVASITNPNGGQFVIQFNQSVTLANTLNEAEINKLVVATGIDKTGGVALQKAELSEDKKTLTVSLKGTTSLEGRYRIMVDGIKTDKGLTLTKYDDIATFTKDTTGPAVASVENVGATKVKVKFTEPINNPVGTTQFKIPSGSIVSGVVGTIGTNATEVIYDLTNARVNGALLAPGTMVAVTFGSIIDISNNLSSPNPLTTHITVGNKDGVLPSLLNVEQLGAKKFKLIFSEEIRALATNDIVVSQNTYSPGVASVVKDEKNPAAYIVTVNGYLNGYATITTAPGKYITDLSGETNVFSTAYNFVADNAQPNVLSAAVVSDLGEEYLEITFDRNVEVNPSSRVQIAGSYVHQGLIRDLPTTLFAVTTKHATNDRVLRVKLSTLLAGVDVNGATYFTNAKFTNISSEYGQPVNNTDNISFVRGMDTSYNQNKIAVYSIETAVNPGSTLDNQTIVITFTQAVDGLTGFNIANFVLDGAVIESAKVRALEPNKVELKVKDSSVLMQYGTNLTVSNIKAAGSILTMEPSRHIVYFNENVRPTNVGNISVPSANEIVLSFTEPLHNILTTSFIVKVNGYAVNVLNATPYNVVDYNGYNQVRLQLGRNLVADEYVTIELAPNSTVSDAAKNLLLFNPVYFTFQTNQTLY
ncbi:S-layer homology domain-containing protein [Solibacillus sp. CAU 1738]|uniref:S-layer homology domain-containing protein n=1 Tax=Solibacillus sp. CAU 1738 TaxID=3140363 RepID=UPI0032614E67